MLANDRNAVGAAVDDQHLAVSVENQPARRAQGEGALVVVLGQFLVLDVLHHLQHPEADRQHREQPGDDVLEHRQADTGAASLFDGHKSLLEFSALTARAGRGDVPRLRAKAQRSGRQ